MTAKTSSDSGGLDEKGHQEHFADAASVAQIEDATLSPKHRQYLLSRHGTLDLSPIPSMDPADPLNWPAWKKDINLILISFHAMMTTFNASCVIPVYETFSEIMHISMTQASYLTSIQILVLGILPIFWKPISNRFGRRPIWLISTIGSLVCNVGCAKANTYAGQVTARVFNAAMISPAIAISSAVVTETFFAKERAQKMGIWTLMVTLGPPTGPFIMGFVAYHTGSWQWIYWILAITNAVQFILYLFFSPETLYNRDTLYNPALDDTEKKGSTFVRQYFRFGRIGPTPMTFRELFAPVKLFLYPSVLLPAIAYAIVFQFCSVMGTVEIPQIFQPKFHFNSQQIGLNFLALIIGSVLGEQLGGWGSDKWMAYGLKRNGGVKRPEPEFRLWLSYFAYGCIICGLVVFTVQTDKLEHYNVSPIVGLAIASFGNQVITTVCTTYAVDSHQNHSGSVGVFINFIRSTWGFIGPLYFPDMFANLGLRGSGGLMVGIVVAAALIPTMFIQWKGKSLRQRKYNKEMEDASGH